MAMVFQMHSKDSSHTYSKFNATAHRGNNIQTSLLARAAGKMVQVLPPADLV
jgi:hypothetical protein